MILARTDATGYYKDVETNTVINNNNDEYANFMQNRERAKQIQRLKQYKKVKKIIKII